MALLVACGGANGSSGSDTGPDLAPQTCEGRNTVQEACEAFRDTLCDRHIECGTFASKLECENWFNDAYDPGCVATTTCLTVQEQEALSKCIEELPTASCADLNEKGAEETIPECGQF